MKSRVLRIERDRGRERIRRRLSPAGVERVEAVLLQHSRARAVLRRSQAGAPDEQRSQCEDTHHEAIINASHRNTETLNHRAGFSKTVSVFLWFCVSV